MTAGEVTRSAVGEVQRLRAALAEAQRERDAARGQLAELQGLVSQHLQLTDQAETDQASHDLATYQRGWLDAEHAADLAHMAGHAHDQDGRPHPLPVPWQPQAAAEPTVDQVIAGAEHYTERQAEWWAWTYQREHPQVPEPAAGPDRGLEAG